MESNMSSPGGGGGSPKTYRWIPTKEQINMLKNMFQSTRTPSAEQIQEITTKLKVYGHIECKNVFFWFQNFKARQREKQKQKQDHRNAESFTRFLKRTSLLFPLPPCPNVVSSPYYMVLGGAGFYPQCPTKLYLPPTIGKKRSQEMAELPSDTLWWTQQQQHTPIMEQIPTNTHFHHRQNTPLSFNLNQENETGGGDRDQEESVEQVICVQKEFMFEKPLTPSDAGKLNRLVIPKQHAEKFFPLSGNGGGESVEKVLLLSFEDESGKTWRFRFSYWNSSHTYVLTKGWKRFVKEKRLDAGDFVVFQRSRHDSDRFFVGWRRRNAAPTVISNGQAVSNYQPHCLHAPAAGGGGGGGLGGMQNQTSSGGGNSKTLRLFGVNSECQSDEAGASAECQSDEHHQQHYNYGESGNKRMALMRSPPNNQETLELFPMHPTGILQDKTPNQSTQNSNFTLLSLCLKL